MGGFGSGVEVLATLPVKTYRKTIAFRCDAALKPLGVTLLTPYHQCSQVPTTKLWSLKKNMKFPRKNVLRSNQEQNNYKTRSKLIVCVRTQNNHKSVVRNLLQLLHASSISDNQNRSHNIIMLTSDDYFVKYPNSWLAYVKYWSM